MDEEQKDALTSALHEVQRLIGECLLRLQRHERLAKAIMVDHHVQAPFGDIAKAQEIALAEIEKDTLGTVMNSLIGSFIVNEGKEGAKSKQLDAPYVSTRVQIVLPEEAFKQMELYHREFVTLRNDLVHHFLEQHDLATLDGCRAAKTALTATLDRIHQAWEVLKSWAESLQQARRHMTNAFDAPEIQDFISTGRFPLAASLIVRALTEASHVLEEGGWTKLDTAVSWVSKNYPDETPESYSCKTWRQVVHNSGLFNLRSIQSEGRRQSWYQLRGKQLDENIC